VATPLPDPIKLLGITRGELAKVLNADAKMLAPLLLAAMGAGVAYGHEDQQQAAKNALYDYAYAILEPYIVKYQGWATELGLETYSQARLVAVGDDGFTPTTFDAQAGANSLMAWMLDSVTVGQLQAAARTTRARRGRVAVQSSGSGLGSYHLNKVLRFSHVAGASSEQVAAWIQGMVTDGVDLRVMGAYNETMQRNALADKSAAGWLRVAEPGACTFCLMLAARASYGILYRSEKTANFRAHTRTARGGGECRCHAIAAWRAGDQIALTLADGTRQVGRLRALGPLPDAEREGEFGHYASQALTFQRMQGALGVIAA
jgi:hypothetical protein